MHRYSLAVVVFIACVAAPCALHAECELVDDGEAIRCDAGDAQVLRDKARAFQLFCEQLPSDVFATHLSSEVAALCEDVGRTSTIYADAKTKRRHAESADRAQREANQCKGALGECRSDANKARKARREAEREAVKWKTLAGILTGISVGLAIVVAGDAAGAWRIRPSG